MSHDSSFLGHQQSTHPASSNRNSDNGSESSYDSTNAYNFHQHQLKQPHTGSGNQSMGNSAGTTGAAADQLANAKQHKTWKEHQKFLQKLKHAKVMEQRVAS